MSNQGRRRLVAGAVVAVVGLLLPACGGDTEEATHAEPARLENQAGSDVKRVILTAKAAERLDVQTVPVVNEPSDPTGKRKVVPYSAVIYTADGSTWTYTSPESRVYVRERIVVDRITGQQAFLSEGPAVGTAVVTVGAPELLGAEYGTGH